MLRSMIFMGAFALALFASSCANAAAVAETGADRAPIARGEMAVVLSNGLRAVAGDMSLAPVWDAEHGLGVRVRLTDWRLDLPWFRGAVDASATAFFNIPVPDSSTTPESSTDLPSTSAFNATRRAMLLRDVAMTVHRNGEVPDVLRLSSGQASIAAPAVYIGTDGAVLVPALTLRTPGGLVARGSLSRSGGGAMSVELSGRAARVAALAALFGGSRSPLSGACDFSARVRLPNAEPGNGNATSADVRLSVTARNMALAMGNRTVAVNGGMTAQGGVGSGTAESVDLRADLTLDNAPVDVQARVSRQGTAWRAEHGRLAFGPDSAIDFSGGWDDGAWNVAAQGEDIAVAPAAALAAAVAGQPFGTWNPGGACDVAVDLSGRGTRMTGRARLAVQGLSFMDPSGRWLLDKGGASLTFAPDADGSSRAVLRVDSGDLLLDTIYLNLAAHPVDADIVLRRINDHEAPAHDTPAWDTTLDASLGGHLAGRAAAVVRGVGRAARADGTFAVSNADIGALYRTFLRDPLSMTNPVVAATQVGGRGRVAMHFSANATNAAIAGDLRVSRGMVNATDPDTGAATLVAQPVELDLPFAYLLGGTGDGVAIGGVDEAFARTLASAPQKWGHLRVGSGTSVLGPLRPVDIALRLTPNILQTRGVLRLPVPGGEARLERMRVDDPLSGSFRLQASAALDRLDFSAIHAGGIALRGGLSGNMGQVCFDAGELSVQRGVNGTLYGGDVRVSGLRVVRPLEDDRRVEASATVRGMDLELLSQALGVGRVTGRMDVALDDFAAAYGQPVAFRLTARSVDTDGVDQLVSLKAVNSISVMGTGSGLTGLSVGVFSSFFKQFAYSDIGFACELNNDVFRIRGLIRDGGVEYLIKKPLFFGINVINGNPDNLISFKDMMERIRRVVTPGGGTPEISGLLLPRTAPLGHAALSVTSVSGT